MNQFYFILVLLFVAIVDASEVTEDSSVEVLVGNYTGAYDEYSEDFENACNGLACMQEGGYFCNGIFQYGKDKTKMYVPMVLECT